MERVWFRKLLKCISKCKAILNLKFKLHYLMRTSPQIMVSTKQIKHKCPSLNQIKKVSEDTKIVTQENKQQQTKH